MPILYACLVNKRRTIITQAYGTKLQGDFGQTILNVLDDFTAFGKKVIDLTAE